MRQEQHHINSHLDIMPVISYVASRQAGGGDQTHTVDPYKFMDDCLCKGGHNHTVLMCNFFLEMHDVCAQYSGLHCVHCECYCTLIMPGLSAQQALSSAFGPCEGLS